MYWSELPEAGPKWVCLLQKDRILRSTISLCVLLLWHMPDCVSGSTIRINLSKVLILSISQSEEHDSNLLKVHALLSLFHSKPPQPSLSLAWNLADFWDTAPWETQAPTKYPLKLFHFMLTPFYTTLMQRHIHPMASTVESYPFLQVSKPFF